MTEPTFILFLSQLPATPSSLRVTVWRRMRAAGAASLQNGVWVLPHRAAVEMFARELLDYVQKQGGTGQIFHVDPLDPDVLAGLEARFRSDRDEEYDEFCERAQEFLAEIEKETRAEKFSFAELEENEQDLARLAGWLDKIQGRDFFGGSRREEARTAVERCRQGFSRFTGEVYKREGLGPDSPNGISGET